MMKHDQAFHQEYTLHGFDFVLLECKDNFMELVNNRITTLKVESTNNHPTKLLFFKKCFF